MTTRKLLFAAAFITLGACAQPQDTTYMGGRPHPLADNSSVYAANRGHQDRENCQGYEMNTADMAYVPTCVYTPPPPPPQAVVYDPPKPVAPPPPALLPVTKTYLVYFDFNKSDVRGGATGVLDEVVADVHSLHPPQVTVTGYTDSVGSAKYNQDLSQKRAETVAKALSDRGIALQVINEQARGKLDQAVPTADGVKLQANRRVSIDFRGEMAVPQPAAAQPVVQPVAQPAAQPVPVLKPASQP